LEPEIVLPKGTLLVINLYGLHREKTIWGPDSHKFNPDNFLPENIGKRHPFSYVPFSAGPRLCIGYKYVNMINRITLIKILRSYKLSTKMKMEDIRLKSFISLKLCTPHMMTIEKRI
jgi:cytochrome P450 family 313